MTVTHQLSGVTPEPEVAPIRVMLVDDSVVARSIFARVLSQHKHIEIVCEAADSDTALEHLEHKDVDIILLDIEMPKRSGLDALPDILDKSNGARVLVVSAFAEENGPAALNALSLGACDTLAKPGRSGFSGRFSEILIDKVVRLGRTARQNKRCEAVVTAKLAVEYQKIARPTCIAIGASTGGIPPIYEIIRNLDPAMDCPIFITQHLPDAFMHFFARQLGGLTDRQVSVATATAACAEWTYLYRTGRCASGVPARPEWRRPRPARRVYRKPLLPVCRRYVPVTCTHLRGGMSGHYL